MARNHSHHRHGRASEVTPAGKMAKDPICGMVIPKATSLKTESVIVNSSLLKGLKLSTS
jgi:P-type Cu+ transporter